jgi:hypothetical protein
VSRRARLAALVRLVATTAALVVGQVVLWRSGRSLPSLPLDRSGLARTLAEADPVALGVSLLRLGGLAAGGALLVATALGVVARCCGVVGLVVHLDRWTPPGLRRLLDGALGAGLAASIGLSALPALADPGPDPAPSTLRRLPDAPTTTLRRLPDGASTTLRRLPDAPAEPSPSPTAGPPAPGPAPGPGAAGVPAAPAPAQPRPAAPDPAPPAPAPRHEVVVRHGDSFWRLAARHEEERLGRRPSEVEVGAYWQELVAANRSRLVVPGDPDLIFPGQVLTLP